MDMLIETATGTEVNRWNGVAGKVEIPGSSDVVFCGTARPLDIGPDHFLATVNEVTEATSATKKRGPDTLDASGQVITLTHTAIDKDADDLLAGWAGQMNESDRTMTRVEEDIIEALDAATKQRLNKEVIEKYNAKKALRATKP